MIDFLQNITMDFLENIILMIFSIIILYYIYITFKSPAVRAQQRFLFKVGLSIIIIVDVIVIML